jgi:DNA-binding FrmR family transcriptional regulator
MLPKNLTKDLKDRLKSVKGQVEGILKMLDVEKDPEQILNQFKAVKQAFDNAQFLLLDEVFRKTMALKIAQALDACPGDCGQEERIEIIRRQFPELGIEELTAKMKEINAIYDFVRKDKNAEG